MAEQSPSLLNSADDESVASPCINVCQIDPDTDLCIGCWRSLDEIANWIHYSAAEKRRVLAALQQRQV